MDLYGTNVPPLYSILGSRSIPIEMCVLSAQDTVEATETTPAEIGADGRDEERAAQLAARRPEGAQLLSEVCRRIREADGGDGKVS